MNYVCCTETIRRNAVKLHPIINGIDFLEVADNNMDPYEERQTTLYLHFLKNTGLDKLNVSNIRISGGERIKNIQVVKIELESDTASPFSPPDEPANVLIIHVSKAGDFSTYTLHLVNHGGDQENTPENFDSLLSSVDFSFKVNCPTDFDCKPVHKCPPTLSIPPEINYLAKDYSSFKQLMLDRIALLMPDWRERNPADLGIVLVEVLAYVADYLSYQQDALATEAYLGTARKRVSVRRHARLVDYFMHDGCNARTWLQIRVEKEADGIKLKSEDNKGNKIHQIITKVEGLPTVISPDSPDFQKAQTAGVRFFELLHDITPYNQHNEMTFYLWGKKDCCLPKGATTATLSGHFPHLVVGDVLIFAEVLGSETGNKPDADSTRRYAVKLTKVSPNYDKLYGGIASPPLSPLSPVSPPEPFGLPITEIEWNKQDALPFPFCISNQNWTNISVAWGNIVLVDHGLTIKESGFDPVPKTTLVYAKNSDADCNCCEPQIADDNIPVRFRPKILQAPLTQCEPYNKEENIDKSATVLIQQSLRAVMPAITLEERDKDNNSIGTWNPKRDLLNSAATAKEFVAEIETDGACLLRFGNDKQGEQPKPETNFIPTYRVGNGNSGNIGANSLTHLISSDADITSIKDHIIKVWNPMTAHGGLEAETMEEVRQFAPEAFRSQERAVTPADYEFFAQRSLPDEVQRAASTFRWTGSWRTVFLTVDRTEGNNVDTLFKKKLLNRLEQYRMAGFDLDVDSPLFVSLDIELTICVNPHFFTTDVKKALLETFSNRILSDGQKGVFHPDNFTFGQPVYLSQIYSLAQSTEGVDSVQISKFCRLGDTDNKAIMAGKLLLGRREIARCDNNRNFPERGVFNLSMNGGR